MEITKGIGIIFLVLIYWKLVYYKFHKQGFTPVSLVLGTATLFFVGIHSYFISKDPFTNDVIFFYLMMVVLMIFGTVLIFLALKKHRLTKNIDITLTYISKYLGRPWIYVALFLYHPIFLFVIQGTRKILGEEHIFFWTMVTIAFIISGIRLYKTKVLK